jgi:mycoredoxin
MSAEHVDEIPDPNGQPVVVYWRPGCGFCSSLLRKLDASGLAFERRNIWEDDDASAFVRTVANGNETVPTVRVGELALVNPTAADVMAQVAEAAPNQLPEGYERPQPGRMAQTVNRLLGGGGS